MSQDTALEIYPSIMKTGPTCRWCSLREDATEMTHHVDSGRSSPSQGLSSIAAATGYRRLKSRGLPPQVAVSSA
jgi:hypothetical protein